MEDLKKYKEVLEEAVKESSKILLENYDTDFKISRKKHYSDLLPKLIKIGQELLKLSTAIFLNTTFLEEIGNPNELRLRLDVDLIDGTVNYAHSVPIFCISIGFEIKKEIVSYGL
jgi:myo-inositol-1(or 4)-monophosphatase